MTILRTLKIKDMTKDAKNTVWRGTESEGCEMSIALGAELRPVGSDVGYM